MNPKDLNLGTLYACREGLVESVACLIEANADIETRDNSDWSPICHAVVSNRGKIIELLLSRGCSVNTECPGGTSLLHLAARRGCDESIKVLLSYNANLNSVDKDGNTPLLCAIKNNMIAGAVVLVKAKCDVNNINHVGRTALHYACHKGLLVSTLISAGAILDIQDSDDNTPLMLAAAEGFSNVIRALASAGADVNIVNSPKGTVALHTLCYKGHAECLDELILAGADVNITDKSNRTPLWCAVKHNRIDVARLLLKATTNVNNCQCNQAWSSTSCPVVLAIKSGHLQIIKLFILAGFDQLHLRSFMDSIDLREKLPGPDRDFWLQCVSDHIMMKGLCRKWIRHYLGKNLHLRVQRLPLPNAIKDYLLLKELDSV